MPRGSISGMGREGFDELDFHRWTDEIELITVAIADARRQRQTRGAIASSDSSNRGQNSTRLFHTPAYYAQLHAILLFNNAARACSLAPYLLYNTPTKRLARTVSEL